MLKYDSINPGDILISSPNINDDDIFTKSVIYIISHDKKGTSGVIINKIISKSNRKSSQADELKDMGEVTKNINHDDVALYLGGPISQDKAIIIHSDDYIGNPLMVMNYNIEISADTKIIEDITKNAGPKHKVLILGYAAWVPDQLLNEIKDSQWLLLTANKSTDIFNLLFIEESSQKWNKALELMGINPVNYGASGNA